MNDNGQIMSVRLLMCVVGEWKVEGLACGNLHCRSLAKRAKLLG